MFLVVAEGGELLAKATLFVIGGGLRVEAPASEGQPPVIALVGPTLALKPRMIPTEYSFAVVLGVRGIHTSDEVAQLTWSVLDSRGHKVVDRAPWSTGGPPIDPAQFGSDGVLMMGAMVANVPLEVSGWYTLQVDQATQDIGSWQFLVRPPNGEGDSE